MAPLGSEGNWKGWDLVGGLLVIGDIGAQPLPLSFVPSHEVNSFALPPATSVS
jgi:hypothetical protein